MNLHPYKDASSDSDQDQNDQNLSSSPDDDNDTSRDNNSESDGNDVNANISSALSGPGTSTNSRTEEGKLSDPDASSSETAQSPIPSITQAAELPTNPLSVLPPLLQTSPSTTTETVPSSAQTTKDTQTETGSPVPTPSLPLNKVHTKSHSSSTAAFTAESTSTPVTGAQCQCPGVANSLDDRSISGALTLALPSVGWTTSLSAAMILLSFH